MKNESEAAGLRSSPERKKLHKRYNEEKGHKGAKGHKENKGRKNQAPAQAYPQDVPLALPSAAKAPFLKSCGASLLPDLLLALPYLLALPLYSAMSRFQSFWPAVNMNLPIDGLLPLYPPAILVYTLWAPSLLGVAIALFFRQRPLYRSYALSLFSAQLLAYLVFALFTSYVPRPELVGATFFERALKTLYRIDGPYAAFPSLHVATTVLMCFHWAKAKGGRPSTYLLCLWGVAICFSTLLVKQHALLDVLGGVLCAGCALALGKFWGGLLGLELKRADKNAV